MYYEYLVEQLNEMADIDVTQKANMRATFMLQNRLIEEFNQNNIDPKYADQIALQVVFELSDSLSDVELEQLIIPFATILTNVIVGLEESFNIGDIMQHFDFTKMSLELSE